MSGPPVPPSPSPSQRILNAIQGGCHAVYGVIYLSGATDRIMQWLLFNVGIALVPLIATYLAAEEVPYPSLMDNLPAKELLLISTALTGDAMGSFVKSSFNLTVRIVLAGVCICLLVLTTNLFSKVPDLPKEVSTANTTVLVSNRTNELTQSNTSKLNSKKKPNQISKPDLVQTQKQNPKNSTTQVLEISKKLFFASLALGVTSKAIE